MNGSHLLLIAVLAWLPFSVGAATFEVGPVTLTLYIVGVLLLIPVALFRALFSAGPYGFRLIDLQIILLCGAYLTSTLLSRDPRGTGYLAVHAILIPVCSYFVTKTLVRTDAEYRRGIAALVAGFSCFGLLSCAAFVASGMAVRVRFLSRDAIAISTMSITALIALAAFRSSPPLWRVAAGAANVSGLAASMARSYLVLLVAAPALWRAVRSGFALVLLLLLLIVSLAGTLFLSWNPDLMKARGWNPGRENSAERLTNIEYWKEGLHGRLLTFRESLRQFEAAPIFGTGMRPPDDQQASTVHNFHLEWLEYGGLTGYLLYAGLLLAHFAAARRAARTDPWCAANLTCMLLILANGLTNGMMHGIMPYVLFLLLGFNEARLTMLITAPEETGAATEPLAYEPRMLGV
jgi:O-antigen ligase